MTTKLEEIRELYFKAGPATIQRDVARAIEILKSMRDEDERSRASVFMQGLADMRREWGRRTRRAARPPRKRG